MYILSDMEIVANRADVLDTIRKNRENHSKIVVEAKAGYLKKADEVLAKARAKLATGEIVSLQFSLRVPLDYTNVYDTAIKMLEMHQGDTLKLNGGQVRNLIQDSWDWTETFYGTNAPYSSSAAANVKL